MCIASVTLVDTVSGHSDSHTRAYDVRTLMKKHSIASKLLTSHPEAGQVRMLQPSYRLYCYYYLHQQIMTSNTVSIQSPVIINKIATVIVYAYHCNSNAKSSHDVAAKLLIRPATEFVNSFDWSPNGGHIKAAE